MNIMRTALFCLAPILGVYSASAQVPVAVTSTRSASAQTSAAATPVSSPAGWVDSADYPSTALRFGMAGITAFQLTLDATGKPTTCDIVESSGFDSLDAATCQRLMINARFSPARDGSGKATEGSYTGRVRWVLPPVEMAPVGENFGSMFLSIDDAGKVTSCRFERSLPKMAAGDASSVCSEALATPPARALALRDGVPGSSVDIVVQVGSVFAPAARDRALAVISGYSQRAVNVHHFTVTSDGKMGECRYEQQRGNETFVLDFCATAASASYDAPFSAFDKNGVANGWHITRVLVKAK